MVFEQSEYGRNMPVVNVRCGTVIENPYECIIYIY